MPTIQTNFTNQSISINAKHFSSPSTVRVLRRLFVRGLVRHSIVEWQALGARLLLPPAVRSASTDHGGLWRRRAARRLRSLWESVTVVGQGMRPFAAELVQRAAQCGGGHRAGHCVRAALRADHIDAAVLHGEAQTILRYIQIVLPLDRSADAHQQLGGLNAPLGGAQIGWSIRSELHWEHF